MLKALVRKQLLELNTFYFQNKSGKRRSKLGTAGFIAAMIALFLVLAGTFGVLSFMFADGFVSAGFSWLFFSMMGMISIFLSSIINMFTANTELFSAQDNELLLSMPIPPMKLLLARMIGLYLWGLLFELITFAPPIIIYWIVKTPATGDILYPIAVFFVNSFVILSLSCIFGWIVALIASRLRNKSVITVLLALALIAVYYVGYFRLNSLLVSAVEHIDELSSAVRGWLYPFYHMGLAAAGKPVSLLLWLLMAAVLTALVCLVLSRSFIRIVTQNRGEKKAVYTEKAAKVESVSTALLKRELKRFTSSATYMLNMGLGLILLPVIGIVLLIRAGSILPLLDTVFGSFPQYAGLLTAAIAAVGCLGLSMSCITAPSVSLEGKTMWLVRSLPLRTLDVLNAKLKMQIYLCTVPAAIFIVTVGIALRQSIAEIALGFLFAEVFIILNAVLGLVLNLKKPNLTWTNETAPIKQGASVAITLFGCWVLTLAFGAGAYFTRDAMSTALYMALVIVVFAAASAVLYAWIRKKGTKIFEEL